MTKISVGLLVFLTITLIFLISVQGKKGRESDVAKDKRYFWKFEWSRCRRHCPLNGKWSKWTLWRNSGGCTGTKLPCIGRQGLYRTRSCTNPKPKYGGRSCRGPSIQWSFRPCKPANTQVNGNWSGWGRWRPIGACSKRCGRGKRLMVRERTCTQPAPRCGGRPCSGSSREKKYKSCRRKRCKVDGKWSGWGNWDHFRACSATCGPGVRYRYRYRACDNPKPQYGGNKCPGPQKDEDFKKCLVQKCPKISNGKDGPINKESTTNQTSTITSGQNSSGNRTETKA
ncbi:semaphorin 5c-like isoform X2 [Crassostrea virginica]